MLVSRTQNEKHHDIADVKGCQMNGNIHKNQDPATRTWQAQEANEHISLFYPQLQVGNKKLLMNSEVLNQLCFENRKENKAYLWINCI